METTSSNELLNGVAESPTLTKDFSHVAMIKARNKINPSLFYSINKILHKKHESLNNNIFAIDGSKVHVPRNFIEKGYSFNSKETRTLILNSFPSSLEKTILND